MTQGGGAGERGAFARLARAGLLITITILASRVLGWLRLIVFAAVFGTSPELDAYFAAFRIPDAVFQLVAGGVLSSVLIPEIAGLRPQGERRAWRAVSGVTTILLVGVGSLATVALVAAPWLAPLIAPGFTPEQQALTADLSRIMLVSPLCFLLGSVAASVLNAEGRFAAAALAPIVYNLAIIIAAVALSPLLGVYALALGVVIGAMAFLAVQLVALSGQTTFRFTFGNPFADAAALGAARRLAPRSVGLAGTQLVFIACTGLASGLGVGAVTAFTLAFTALRIPVGLLGVPLGIVLFPSMARSIAVQATDEFRSMLVAATRLALWGAALVSALGVILSLEMATLLFGHGALERGTVRLVASTLLVLLLGVGAHSVNLVLARAFYALRDTRTPVLLTLGQVVLTVVVAAIGSSHLGLPGVAVGVAAGSWAKALAMLAILGLRGWLSVPSVAGAGGTAAGLAVVAGVAGYGAVAALHAVTAGLSPLPASATALVGGSVVATIAYVAGSAAMRLPELDRAVRIGREGFRRRGRRADVADQDG